MFTLKLAQVTVLFFKVDYVSLTTDGWTSRKNESYLTVTVHYINKKMQMKSRVLSTFSSDKNHTAHNLQQMLLAVTDSWGITNKVVACVTDNAANIKAAILGSASLKLAPIKGWRHVECFAHTLQLAVKDAWKSNLEAEPLMTKCRNIVTFFHSSTVAAVKLRQLSPGTGKRLKQDVVTRWNSTVIMLKSLLDLEVSWILFNCFKYVFLNVINCVWFFAATCA